MESEEGPLEKATEELWGIPMHHSCILGFPILQVSRHRFGRGFLKWKYGTASTGVIARYIAHTERALPKLRSATGLISVVLRLPGKHHAWLVCKRCSLTSRDAEEEHRPQCLLTHHRTLITERL
jgi:hypothetical protein